jgi:hypothetical protein
LLALADSCFAQMPERGSQEHAGLLLQAQFYMNEVARRHDSTIARRDLILELIIIGLIVAEIAFGIVEGNKQAAILDQMNASASATAITHGARTNHPRCRAR